MVLDLTCADQKNTALEATDSSVMLKQSRNFLARIDCRNSELIGACNKASVILYLI